MKHWKGTISVLLLGTLVGLLALVAGCVAPPVASFTTDKTNVAVGAVVQFSNNSGGEITSWSWDFGDGITSAEENPSHAYAQKGSYTVSLTVSNEAGSDTATLAITVLVAPTANFSASKSEASIGSSIQFTDESSGDIDSWSWDFGDGSSSTKQNPSHTYKDAGLYTVSLTVSNAASSDTKEKKDCITMTNLAIVGIEMCSDVKEAGEYTPQPDATFRVGDDVWIYFEVTGFKMPKTDGKYEYWIQWTDLSWYDPDGNLRMVMSDLVEFHETYPVAVPIIWLYMYLGEAGSGDPVGEYRVEVKVEDKLGGERATEFITFILE